MANEENKKSYVNPDFTSAFERVKRILSNLVGQIKPVKQGNAADFRAHINNAIGTVPEFEEKTESGEGIESGEGTESREVTETEENTNISIKTDGSGMSGAVFAMGEAFEIGLSNLGDALNQFDTDAQDILTKATDSKDKILEHEKTAKASADNAKTSETNAKTSADNALTSANNASTYETNAQTSANKASTYETNAKTSATETANTATEAKRVLDSLTFEIGEKFEQALEDAAGNANQAAEDAREAAKGIITNTFFVVAEADSATNSYPVTKDEQGNETRIKQEAPGAIWFKIIKENENTEIV